MFWEGVLVSFDSSVCGFDISGFKGRFANDQGVNDYTERPNIHFVRMSCSSFQHFRRDVVRSTANGSFLFSIKIELGSQTEVTQFDLHFIIDEQIAQLQVSVNDSVGVQVLQSTDDLHGVALDLQLVKSFPAFEKFIETVVGAQFKQDIDILHVFEKVHKLSHVHMLHRPVDFDLAH
jgi:hypothetical protein